MELAMNSVPNLSRVDLSATRRDFVGSPDTAMIKVSIVEDDAKLRESLVRYLAGQSGFRCVRAYANANAEAALADIPQQLPDVCSWISIW